MESLHKSRSTGKAATSRRDVRDLARESVEELRKRLRQQREQEEAEEALKDKVRQLRLQGSDLPAESKSKDVALRYHTR